MWGIKPPWALVAFLGGLCALTLLSSVSLLFFLKLFFRSILVCHSLFFNVYLSSFCLLKKTFDLLWPNKTQSYSMVKKWWIINHSLFLFFSFKSNYIKLVLFCTSLHVQIIINSPFLIMAWTMINKIIKNKRLIYIL